MPITFLDNYPRHALEENFLNREGNVLYGELWVYQQLIGIEHIVDEQWYVKHSYPLSKHPHSRKQEGEIDFLIIGPKGILVIEVKGGAIEYCNGRWYYMKNGIRTKEFSDPFEQVRDNMFSLKDLVNIPDVYYYRAVIFPHERNIDCRGPNHDGYRGMLYTAKDFIDCRDDSERTAMRFLEFLQELPKRSRLKQVESYAPGKNKETYNKMIWEEYPEINRIQIDRVRRSLFQDFQSYGFDIDRLNKILYDQNYDILVGLHKNKRIMIEGPPGSGKTVIAKKFIAQQRKLDQRGIYVCANILLAAYMRWLLYEEHGIDAPSLRIMTFKDLKNSLLYGDVVYDYLIIDEAQEFFDKGLEDVLNLIEVKFSRPLMLLLYDLEQAYGYNHNELPFFQDFIMREGGFSHYTFHKVFRCSQCKDIQDVSEWVRDINNKNWHKLGKRYDRVKRALIENAGELYDQFHGAVESLRTLTPVEIRNTIILIESKIYPTVTGLLKELFTGKFEELTEENIATPPNRLRYTTPLKYKGLESENVILITAPYLDQGSSRTESYVGTTRAIFDLKILLWKKA